MICPECKNEPFSKLDSFINGMRRVKICKNCETHLRASKSLKRGNIVMLLIEVLLMIIILNSENLVGYKISLLIGFAIIVVVWLVASQLLWSFGALEKVEKANK